MATVWKRSAAVVLLAAGLSMSACTSGGGQPGVGSSGNASGGPGSSSAIQSVSVPPDVPKDSIRDLNSTKDMTGVVTTIPETENPYVGHLPNVCKLLPKGLLKTKLDVDRTDSRLDGNHLAACQFIHHGIDHGAGSIGYFTENIQDFLEISTRNKDNKIIQVTSLVSGYQLRPKDDWDGSCTVAWGTFYGTATAEYQKTIKENSDPCSEALNVAVTLIEYLPRSPSQMRK